MKRVYIYCEGLTEEIFVNNILAPYLLKNSIVVTPIVCETSRTTVAKHRGGISNYAKVRREITALCKQDKNAFVTTMFDYYGMPDNTPAIDCKEQDIQKRITVIEDAINCDIAQPNFRFHFMLHEFEALLFSNPKSFGTVFGSDSIADEIAAIRNAYKTPEDINNSRETAPSKRLMRLIQGYRKNSHGIQLAKEAGIDVMLKECPHFRCWISELLSL